MIMAARRGRHSRMGLCPRSGGRGGGVKSMATVVRRDGVAPAVVSCMTVEGHARTYADTAECEPIKNAPVSPGGTAPGRAPRYTSICGPRTSTSIWNGAETAGS